MVFCVHTFLNNGYYNTAIDTPIMYIGTYIRQFCMIYVPLFIMLTGYLHSGKEINLDKKHLLKLLKVLVPYTIITILTYFVLNTYNRLNGRTLISLLFGFEDNGYAWYIEMYIGLFLLIPFLNASWNALKTKEKREGLIIALIFLCFIPNLVNAFYPAFPNYWVIIYPIAYYFTGMYLKEYGLNMKAHNKLFTIGISSVVHFIMAITLFKENLWSECNAYHNIFCFINSVMVFDLLLNIKTDNIKAKTRKAIANTADAVLPAYMISYIVDLIVYGMYVNNFISTVEMRILCMIPIIFITATLSISLGKIITRLTNILLRKKKETGV